MLIPSTVRNTCAPGSLLHDFAFSAVCLFSTCFLLECTEVKSGEDDEKKLRQKETHPRVDLLSPSLYPWIWSRFSFPLLHFLFQFGIWSIKSFLGERVCSRLGSRPGCCSHFSLCMASQQRAAKEELKAKRILTILDKFIILMVKCEEIWSTESGSAVGKLLCVSAVCTE